MQAPYDAAGEGEPEEVQSRYYNSEGKEEL
jgi:hypothetical protein